MGGEGTVSIDRGSGDRFLWSVNGVEDRLMPYDTAVEEAAEGAQAMGGFCLIEEYRPAEANDVDDKRLTDELWDALDTMLSEDEELAWDDGRPVLVPTYFRAGRSERPPAWGALRAAVDRVLREACDYREAAWQRTGVRKLISESGEPVERIRLLSGDENEGSA
jgi:hypothetical protein